MFQKDHPKDLAAKSLEAGVSKDEFHDFMQYVAAFYGNMGNYLSFGDTKFIVNLRSSNHPAPHFTTLFRKAIEEFFFMGRSFKPLERL